MNHSRIPEALHRKDIYRMGNLSIDTRLNAAGEAEHLQRIVWEWGRWIAPDSPADDWRIIEPIFWELHSVVIGAVLKRDENRQVRLILEKGILVEVLWNNPQPPQCPDPSG
jgi:hypothetical protein